MYAKLELGWSGIMRCNRVKRRIQYRNLSGMTPVPSITYPKSILSSGVHIRKQNLPAHVNLCQPAYFLQILKTYSLQIM